MTESTKPAPPSDASDARNASSGLGPWPGVATAAVAGFVAVLVGFTSSVVIVFQAAAALGANAGQTVSWIWALGLGMGLTSLGLSVWYRQPVLTAWSTPGAAVIAASAAATGTTLPEATGAFVICALLIVAAGVSGLFARLMDHIPQALAAALLAGVLVRFALDAFAALPGDPLLVGGMGAAYLLGRRFWPRYAVPGVLVLGIAIAAAQGRLAFDAVALDWAVPVFVMPEFTLAATVGLALPLFVVTMASQNLPGVAAQRAAGYTTPVSPTIAVTGLATLVLAPFGGYALNLAAITAAICMGREAHEDPARRWLASAFAGIFYIVLGLLGGAVVALIAAFPKALVLAVAGLALLGTIGNGLAVAMKNESEREPALIAFLVTASGLSLAGIGSAFWGVVAGGVAWGLLRRGRTG